MDATGKKLTISPIPISTITGADSDVPPTRVNLNTSDHHINWRTVQKLIQGVNFKEKIVETSNQHININSQQVSLFEDYYN
jgi:hypothetical protein